MSELGRQLVYWKENCLGYQQGGGECYVNYGPFVTINHFPQTRKTQWDMIEMEMNRNREETKRRNEQ